MTSTRRALAVLRSADPVLRAADPVPSTPAPAAAPTWSAPQVPRRRGHATRRRWVAAVSAAAIVAVGVGVGSLVTPRAASPAAAAALDRAASAADIAAQDEAALPQQYWRIRTTATYLGMGQFEQDAGEPDSSWLEHLRRTEYVAVDGSRPTWFAETPRRITQTLTGPARVGSETSQASVWTTDLAPDETPGSWQGPSPDWLTALPRDTQELRKRLYADTSGRGASHDGEVLVYVADVLRSGLVPADLRAALFRVLETVPGVDVVRRHDDGLISIGRLEPRRGERSELLIDPLTGDYVGERTVQVKGLTGIPAGTITADVAVVRTLVESVPASVRAQATRLTCSVDEAGGTACSQQE